MAMYGDCNPLQSLMFLDILGLVFGMDINIKICLISRLFRIAPSQAYLRLRVNTAVLENLHISMCLFDDALCSGVHIRGTSQHNQDGAKSRCAVS